MNILRKTVSAITLSAALAGCAAPQNGPESPEGAVDHTRNALAQLGATGEGVQVWGAFLESVACQESANQDIGEEMATIDADKALDDTCASTAPGGFVPKMQGRKAQSGNVYCVTMKTPLTDACTGQ